MTIEANAWWGNIVPKLRRAFGFGPLSLDEAEREMANAEAVPMSEEEIQRIVDVALEMNDAAPL